MEDKVFNNTTLDKQTYYDNLVSLLPFAVLRINGEKIIVEANNSWYALTGYTINEVINKKITQFIHPDDQNIFTALYFNASETDLMHTKELQVYSSNSSILHVEISAKAIFDNNRKLDSVQLLISDKTTTKQNFDEPKLQLDQGNQFLDIANVLILVLSSDQKILLINKKGCEMLECSKNDILGKNWFEHFLPADESDMAKKQFHQIIRGKENLSSNYENHIVTRTGNRKLIAWHNTLLTDNQGKIIGTLSSGSDITEKRLIEYEMQKNEIKFRYLFDKSSIGLLFIDSETKIIEINNKAKKLTGLNIAMYMSESPFLREINLMDKLKQSLSSDETLSGEYHIFSHDETEYYIRIGLSSMRSGFIDGILVVIEDITALKLAEINLRAKNEELLAAEEEIRAANDQLIASFESLKESEQNLKLKLDYILSPETEAHDLQLTDLIDVNDLQHIQDKFAEATGVASIITDLNGKPITRASNFCGVCALIRTSEIGRKKCFNSDKLIGRKAASTLKPTYEACHSCGFVDGGAPIVVGNKHLAIWMIGQASIGQVDAPRIADYACELGLSSELMLNEYRKMQTMPLEQFIRVLDLLWLIAKELSTLAYNNLNLARSIEQRKRYELDLQKALVKAEESDRLKSAFLANMSHEIRTPMNGIIGFSQFLDRDNLRPEKRKEYISIIHTSANQLLAIISDIIDISKIEAGQMYTKNYAIHINDMLQEILLTFNTDKQQRSKSHIDLKLNCGLPYDRSNIMTDEVRLRQIIQNLLTNALKFTNDGFIEFGYIHQSNILLFYVRDTGIGISREKREIIFQRFRQEDETITREYGGSGLGLAICKGLLQLLGGKIWFESEKGVGSVFYFSLPYISADDQQIEKRTTHQTDTANWENKTILVVEDVELNYRYICEILEETNINILRAVNGEDAIHQARINLDIDLVLMDIQLPVINGYDAALQIMQFRKIPIIAQTAYAMAEDREKCLSLGFSEYITKPFSSNQLIEILNQFL